MSAPEASSEPSIKRATLPARAAGMLLRPGHTLAIAAGETTTQREIWTGYILPLAAIAPVCRAIGLMVFGASIAGVGIQLRTTWIETLLGAAIDYVLALVSAYVLALVVDLSTPLFGGVSNRVQALKLVALSGTAVWLAGAFDLYPTLGFPMGILGGLWSLYALYLGLPLLMRTTRANQLNHFAVVLVAAVLLALLLRLAAGFVR
jgi:hypothetical protein